MFVASSFLFNEVFSDVTSDTDGSTIGELGSIGVIDLVVGGRRVFVFGMRWLGKAQKTEGMTPIFILTTHCDVLSKSSALKCSEHKTADFDGTKFSRLSALTHLLRSVSFFGNLYNHKTSNNTPQLRIDCLWLVSPLIQETIFLFTIFRHVTPPPPPSKQNE